MGEREGELGADFTFVFLPRDPSPSRRRFRYLCRDFVWLAARWQALEAGTRMLHYITTLNIDIQTGQDGIPSMDGWGDLESEAAEAQGMARRRLSLLQLYTY